MQENFLNQARRDSLLLSVRLVTGTELRGRIDGFDNFTVILVDNSSRRHMIYKHAIANITMLGAPRRKGQGGPRGQQGRGQQERREEASKPASRAQAPADEGSPPEGKPPFNPAMQKLAGLKEGESAAEKPAEESSARVGEAGEAVPAAPVTPPAAPSEPSPADTAEGADEKAE